MVCGAEVSRLKQINMYAYELYPRLSLLTLTVDNEAEYWEDRLEFIGTNQQWNAVRVLENQLMNSYEKTTNTKA